MGTEVILAWFAVPVVYLTLRMMGRWLRRRLGAPLGVAYVLLSVCLAFLAPGAWMDYHPDVHRGLLAASLLLATMVMLDGLRQYYWEAHIRRRHGNRVPEFVRQVVQVTVFLVVAVAILYFLYDYRIPGLLAGSGILAIILGLAVQDLLGNVIAGYAVHAEKAFRPGDWLFWEQQHVQVVETNWRATRCRTNDDVHLDIPNSVLAKAVITNFSYPAACHGLRVTIPVDRNAPPNRVKDVLFRAARGVGCVVAQPPPKIFLTGFNEWAALYEVRVWIEDHGRQNEVRDGVHTLAWYGLRRAGIAIPQPAQVIQMVRRPGEMRLGEAPPSEWLAGVDLFRPLSSAQCEHLACRGARHRYGRGERIVEQGAAADSLFVLLQGQAEVVVQQSDGDRMHTVATLGPGDCFGEMSLLTGEPRSGTVIALADCEVLEIAKDDLAEMLRASPGLAEALSAMAAERRQGTLEVMNKERPMASESPAVSAASVLSRLRGFFGL